MTKEPIDFIFYCIIYRQGKKNQQHLVPWGNPTSFVYLTVKEASEALETIKKQKLYPNCDWFIMHINNKEDEFNIPSVLMPDDKDLPQPLSKISKAKKNESLGSSGFDKPHPIIQNTTKYPINCTPALCAWRGHSQNDWNGHTVEARTSTAMADLYSAGGMVGNYRLTLIYNDEHIHTLCTVRLDFFSGDQVERIDIYKDVMKAEIRQVMDFLMGYRTVSHARKLLNSAGNIFILDENYQNCGYW